MTDTHTQAASWEELRSLPKVVLHDHLDGGLRPATMIELADQVGHELPAATAQELGDWFVQAADSGSLVRYLETFEHTLAVMQTAEGLNRVAYEMVLDMAADGVIYAESRWAPEQHLSIGLTLQQAVDAVQAGIDRGVAAVTAGGGQIRVNQILSAMRHLDNWDQIADLALANRETGVVGLDIAGPEAGFAPDRFPGVWEKLALANFPVTIHAGEADGLESINQAIHIGRARRLGHGARLADDITEVDAEHVAFGRVAHWIMDNQIPLELCPCSNLQTGISATIAAHPITALKDMGFAVTINTDNRLMSGTSMTNEMYRLRTEAGWTLDDFLEATLTAAWATFMHQDERDLLGHRILAAYEPIID